MAFTLYGSFEEEETKQDDTFKMYGSFDDEVEEPTKPAPIQFPEVRADTISDLLEGKSYAVVEEYMNRRHGMNERTHSRQEVVDSFVNHMRKFNFGQSVVVGTELAWLNSKEDKLDRMAAGNAYKLFDGMKNAFSGDYTMLDKADAVYDYGRALIVDPVNLLSLGVGKLVSGGLSKAAAQTAKEAVRQAIKKELGEKALKATASSSLKAQAKQIERRIIGRVIKGEAVEGVAEGAFKQAAKKTVTREIAGTTAFDTLASVSIDAVYQKAFMQADVQTEYNILQGAITGAGGVFGGTLAWGLSRLSKAPHNETTLPLAISYFDDAAKAEAQAIKLASDAMRKSNKEALKDINSKEFAAAVAREADAAERWAAKVLRGDTLRRTADDAAEPRRDALLGAFLNGAADGSFKGIKGILEDFDIRLANETTNFKNFTDFLTETIKQLPDEAKAAVSDLYAVTLQRLPEFEGKKLETGMDILSSISSEWGRTGATLAKLSNDLGLAKSKTPAQKMNEVIEETLDAAPKGLRDKLDDAQGTLQRNLIRMLVTHPGTTALNLIGWTNASSMQTASDMLRGALFGGASVGNALIGRKASAVDYANKAKLMLTLQKQKATNLVSPFATQQATMDFISANPAIQGKLFRYLSGGIELDDVYKELGIAGTDMQKAGFTEKVMDFAQTMYGVKAQDVYTKSQEFMYALDKQIRLKYGVTYSEFITDTDNLWKRMKGDEYAEVQAAAVEDALRNVYAKSYGENPKGLLTYSARVLEDLRKYPGIGAMVPFGQFFNNTLGHIFDHTGISLVHKYVAGTTRDPMELLTKSAVGLSVIGIATAREYDNMEEGLAWYQERQSDGQVRNRLYDFPFSFYKAIGRMSAHIHRDGEVPAEMTRDIIQTFGPGNLTRQLGESSKMAFDLLVDVASGEDVAVVEGLKDVVKSAGSMYLSGYSRPLDPVNQIIALGRGEDYTAIDRKQNNEWINNSARYVDQIFTALSGKELAPEKYSPTSGERGMAPIGRIFGFRAEPRQSATQRMFNEAGLPQWRTNIKAFIPETNNEMNKIIFQFLEDRATYVTATPGWRSASAKERVKMLRDTITLAKKDVMGLLESSIDPRDTRTLKLWNLSKRGGGVSEEDVTKALRDLGIEKEVTELNSVQLDFLLNYIEMQKEELKGLVESGRR
jgi:hypothetical protein